MICFASLTSCVFDFECMVRPKPSLVFLKEVLMTREVQVKIKGLITVFDAVLTGRQSGL